MSSTYPKRVTRPLEDATMAPSSPTVYSAEMLSCRNKPSGSFFCRAYHFPAYCQTKPANHQSSYWALSELVRQTDGRWRKPLQTLLIMLTCHNHLKSAALITLKIHA